MKKLLIAAFALTAAASVFAQGSVVFNNNNASIATEFFAPLATSGANMYVSQVGNGNNTTYGDFPSGTVNWSSWVNNSLWIGNNGNGGQFGATDTLIEILSAPGTGQPVSSLVAATGQPITDFQSGVNAGFLVQSQPTLSGIAASATAVPVTFEIAAWDDSSGQYATWATASVAWMSGKIAAATEVFNYTGQIGGTTTSTPVVSPFLTGYSSENLYYQQVPEPATFALCGLGLATLLVFRRRK